MTNYTEKGILIFLALLLLLVGCNKSESGGSNLSIDNSNQLTWSQDPYYEDNTYMDLFRDVKGYEVFISDKLLLDNEAYPIAYIVGSYFDNGGKLLVSSSFDLNLLRPFGYNVDNGVKYVFMKTETQDNVASEFSTPYVWGETYN